MAEPKMPEMLTPQEQAGTNESQEAIQKPEVKIKPREQAGEELSDQQQQAGSNQPSTESQLEGTSAKSETLSQIENIMQEDLRETYAEMSPEEQKEFKEKGEETAKEIETLMARVKVNSKKVFDLIFSWLKIIPGVNKYFLQQEAKLKTDKILETKEELDKSRSYN